MGAGGAGAPEVQGPGGFSWGSVPRGSSESASCATLARRLWLCLRRSLMPLAAGGLLLPGSGVGRAAGFPQGGGAAERGRRKRRRWIERRGGGGREGDRRKRRRQEEETEEEEERGRGGEERRRGGEEQAAFFDIHARQECHQVSLGGDVGHCLGLSGGDTGLFYGGYRALSAYLRLVPGRGLQAAVGQVGVGNLAAQPALPEGRARVCRLLIQLSRHLGGRRTLARPRMHEHVCAEASGAHASMLLARSPTLRAMLLARSSMFHSLSMLLARSPTLSARTRDILSHLP